MELYGNSEDISAPEYFFEESVPILPTQEDDGIDVLSTIITEAADGILVANTISKVMTVIEDMVIENNKTNETRNYYYYPPQETWTQTILEPVPSSKFTELCDGEISKIITFLSIEAKRLMRLVSFRWKVLLDKDFLTFQQVLTRSSIWSLKTWTDCNIEKLIVCNLLDVESECLKSMGLWRTVKHLEIESQRVEDYENHKGFKQPTVGEKNLVEILKLCTMLETLVLNSGSVGNFGLELLEVNKDENCNEIVVGWQWPKVHESVTAVGDFLKKILGDLDQNFGNLEIDDGSDHENPEVPCEPHPSQIIPSDPPGVEITYQINPPPPFPAFLSLASVILSHLQNLSITVQPTKNSEKMGLIAFLHVLSFPKLHSFTIHCEEYIPDEALYRSLFRFILKHKETLKKLTLTNPILSTNFAYAGVGANQNYLAGLEKVRLREMTIAWELPIGLDMYWSNGHYLLESQRRLRKLEFHTTNTFKAATVVLNNFSYWDFIHFIHLPCLEQLHLPRIHVQDPRVTRFCTSHCKGITQERDFFLIDRRKFVFHNAYTQYFGTTLTE
ncbi:unnamed protein product [Allacma fusca]|uniref:F-box domain-containing protein n=1 Tax=Allacma fusca TaxID=39272 RepID=A0A8J2KQQ8_9HEXA|nr:unnamed protein product [Allacma fusca]